jgi:hypothetical protein
LGDVGGLMEVFFSLFRIISSFLADTLYEKSLVNHLFSFDLERKVLLIKDNKKNKKINFLQDDSPKIYSPETKLSPHPQSSLFANEDATLQSRNKFNEELLSKTKLSNENILLKPKKKKKKKSKSKSSTNKNENNIQPEKANNININLNAKECNTIALNNCDGVEEKDKNKENNQYLDTQRGNDVQKDGQSIIHKVKDNKCCVYCCFLCVRKRKNLQNVLLDEGMKVITEKLDIMNLFKKIYRDEKLQEKEMVSHDSIEMSDECKENLLSVYKK